MLVTGTGVLHKVFYLLVRTTGQGKYYTHGVVDENTRIRESE